MARIKLKNLPIKLTKNKNLNMFTKHNNKPRSNQSKARCNYPHIEIVPNARCNHPHIEIVPNARCNHPHIEIVPNARCNHPHLAGGSKLQSNFGEGASIKKGTRFLFYSQKRI